MDFDLSEEQTLLKDSIHRLLDDRYGFEARRGYAAEDGGYSAAMWGRYAELGLLGLPFSEADGGFGGGPIETLIAMEAFGRALVLEPFLATAILGGGAVRAAATAEQKARLVPGIVEGTHRLALAHQERGARYELAHVETTATRDGDDFVLDGKKTLVLHGDAADTLVVSARTDGEARDEAGVTLFLVAAAAEGVSRRGYPTQDGSHAAEVALSRVRVAGEDVLGEPGAGMATVRRVVDEAIAALCAEAVGAMEKAHELTVEYLKTRTQFGRPLGSFQVLQHRAADMYVALEQARSMAMYAAMMAGDPDPAERGRAVSAAKVQVSRSGGLIGQEAVQLHGGVGMTMEYQVGHYFKRLTMIDKLFGDLDHHLDRVGRAGGLVAA